MKTLRMLPAVTLGLLATILVAASPATSAPFRGVSPSEAARVAALQAKAKRTAPTKFVRTWSYVGPRAELAHAHLELRDRDGRLVASATAGKHGTYAFNLSRRRGLKLPLTLTATGGTAAKKAFKGTLVSRIFSVSPQYAVVQNSLVSTAASKMATTKSGYSKATGRVRRTLGLQGTSPDVLRLRNSDVGYSQLMRAQSRAGGFDALVDLVVRRTQEGKRITGLKPKSAMASAAPGMVPPVTRRRSNQTSMPADTSVCIAGVPTYDTSFSNEGLTDIATLGVGSLMQVAGLPETGATESITGMLLSPIGMDSGATVQQSAYDAVANDLYCLSEQNNYLSKQIAYLQLTVDTSTASSCLTKVNGTNAWGGYTQLVSNADTAPINADNTALTGLYLPAWNGVNDSCGNAVDEMLWGNAAAEIGSSWQQLTDNVIGGLPWITGAQTQELQTFLNSWGNTLYEQFIMSNEYDNYYGGDYFGAAQAAAGSVQNSAGQAVCGTPATATEPAQPAADGADTDTYCVWQANIGAAWPGDLYSDEIGVISTGNSINAIPGGIDNFVPINSQSKQWGLADTNAAALQYGTPTAMNLAWWYNYYLNFNGGYSASKGGSNGLLFATTGGTPTCTQDVMGNCPPDMQSADFPTASVNWFNAQGVNPGGLGSAVQTYANPQNTNRVVATSSDISALASAGPGGQSSTSFLYDAVNQVNFNGSPAWTSVSPSDITYWTADPSSSIQLQDEVATYFGINIEVKAPLGSTAGVSANNKNNQSQNNLPTTPVFAFLMKRNNWWPGASTSTNYQPPTPPGP